MMHLVTPEEMIARTHQRLYCSCMDQYEGKPVKTYNNIDEYSAMLQTTTVETEIMIDRAVDDALPGYEHASSRVDEALETGEEVTPVTVALDLLDNMYGFHSDLSRMHLMASRETLGGFSIADLLQAGMLKEALDKVIEDIDTETRFRK